MGTLADGVLSSKAPGLSLPDFQLQDSKTRGWDEKEEFELLKIFQMLIEHILGLISK